LFCVPFIEGVGKGKIVNKKEEGTMGAEMRNGEERKEETDGLEGGRVVAENIATAVLSSGDERKRPRKTAAEPEVGKGLAAEASDASGREGKMRGGWESSSCRVGPKA
jgi:hypothetical protein